MKKILLILFLIPVVCFSQRPMVAGWNEQKVKILSSNFYYPAMIYLPSDYYDAAAATKKYPVIFSFHGSGQAGSDTTSLFEDGWIKNISHNGVTSYGGYTLGSDVPSANDVNGNNRTAIVVAVQAASYGVNPSWFPYMFPDVTGRLGLRIDSSMVYLYGYSAGNWAASGIITANADTTYNRFISAIIVNSGATQDLTPHTNFSKIGIRRIPTLLVVGASDISYRDQMINERDIINANSNPDVALYEAVSGQGHSGFSNNALNSKTWTVTGGKNFVQWAFSQRNTYATTWTPSGSSSPVANAGADQNVWMPKNTVTLSGSGSTGTITSITWTHVSSSPAKKTQEATISNPSGSLTTTINNLPRGVHTFRLTTSDGSTTTTDDVNVVVYGFKSRIPNLATDTIFLTPSGGEYYFPNIMAPYPNIRGGTVIYLTQSAGLCQFYGEGADGGWGGDSVNQVTITTAPGVVIGGAFRCNGQYIKIKNITFRPNSPTAIAGIVLPSKHRNIEVTGCVFEGSENAIYAKSIVDTMDARTYNLNWDFYGNYFHHNTISDTRGEAMYLNHTFSDEDDLGNSNYGIYTPLKMSYLRVSWNTLRRIGWDGIQVSNAPYAEVTHNTIDSTGLICKSSQLFGILIGGYSLNARADSNDIRNTKSAAIAIFGNGTNKAWGNYIFNGGYADIQTDLNCNSGNPFTAIYINDNRVPSIGAPSPALQVDIQYNCIQGLTAYTGGAAIENRDGNSTTLPGLIKNNKILDPLGRALSAVIKSNTTGDDISLNTIASCVGNIPPTARAGIDIPALTGTFTILDGSLSTDPDGTITSYVWQQVSGPSQATFSSTNQSTVTISNLIPGKYTFRLTVTDNGEATSFDEVEVNVIPPVIYKPTVNLKRL